MDAKRRKGKEWRSTKRKEKKRKEEKRIFFQFLTSVPPHPFDTMQVTERRDGSRSKNHGREKSVTCRRVTSSTSNNFRSVSLHRVHSECPLSLVYAGFPPSTTCALTLRSPVRTVGKNSKNLKPRAVTPDIRATYSFHQIDLIVSFAFRVIQ